MTKKDDKVEKTSEDMVQIPKAEFEGLKTQLEEMNKFRTETEDYLKGASVVVNTLASDPDLTNAFRAKLTGVVEQPKVPSQQPQQVQTQTITPPADDSKAKQYSQDINELKGSQKEEIIAAFEKEYGISSLPEEQRRDTRIKIESYLNDFGWSISGRNNVPTPPLTNLRNHLEKAYMGTHAEKLKEEGKLEGFVQARANDQGIMGSFPSGVINNEGGEKNLSEGQKKWAEKLGVNEDKAKETYFAKDNEQNRISGAEKRAEEVKKAQ